MSLRKVVAGAAGPPLEVAIIHHTQCGSSFLANNDFRQGFAARTGLADADLQAAAVVDPHRTVRADVQRLRSSPLVDGVVVSGHVLDLQTGRVETVLSAASQFAVERTVD
jgi:carbonic anhydrase